MNLQDLIKFLTQELAFCRGKVSYQVTKQGTLLKLRVPATMETGAASVDLLRSLLEALLPELPEGQVYGSGGYWSANRAVLVLNCR